MKDEKRMRVSDEELELLKSTFADDYDFLLTIRNLFFGLDVTKEQSDRIANTFSGNDNLLQLMRKMFLPEVSGEVPLGQTIDLWLSVEIKDKDEEEVKSVLESRARLIVNLEKTLQLLSQPSLESVNINIYPDNIKDYSKVDVLVRNSFITHIEQVLMQINVLSGMKEETVEQMKERLKKNSSK